MWELKLILFSRREGQGRKLWLNYLHHCLSPNINDSMMLRMWLTKSEKCNIALWYYFTTSWTRIFKLKHTETIKQPLPLFKTNLMSNSDQVTQQQLLVCHYFWFHTRGELIMCDTAAAVKTEECWHSRKQSEASFIQNQLVCFLHPKPSKLIHTWKSSPASKIVTAFSPIPKLS